MCGKSWIEGIVNFFLINVLGVILHCFRKDERKDADT